MSHGQPAKRDVIRWARTIVRSFHIPAVALVMGAWWLGETEWALGWPFAVALLSGLGLAALFFEQSLAWPFEVRGVVVVVKLGVLASLSYVPADVGAGLLIAVAFMASIASHMPGRHRHFRVDRALLRLTAAGQ